MQRYCVIFYYCFCSLGRIIKAGFDYIGITTPFYCHDEEGYLCLHKRSKNCRDEQGTWDPGSGQLEMGLSVEENIHKEIKEEYGCEDFFVDPNDFIPAHSIFREFDGIKTH